MMNKIVIIGLAFFIFSICGQEQKSAVDALFQAYRGDVPGAALMVIHDGRPILTRTYGLADVEKKIPVTAQSNFRLASVTKQFTSMCIMMLVERGQLHYETTLTEVFPEFPDYGKSITIRHLLQHTSGLVDYEDLLNASDTVQVLDRDVLRLMMAQDSTYFTPGSHYQYSNSAYAVLAMIVEKFSGLSFARFLDANIFDPLQMTHSIAYEKGISTVDERAYGYVVTGDSIRFSDQSQTSAVLGDGGIYSSVQDLYLWDQSLYTQKLVKSITLQQAFSAGITTDGDTLSYGFGWRIDTYRGHERVYHTGSTCGFRNIIGRYPDAKLTVIILTNRSEPELLDLANRVTDIFL